MNGSPDVEAILSRFRQWLGEARAEADWLGDDPSAPVADGPEVGLFRLAEEFTALRQEVKLQTKSARGLQDEAEALLPALRQAIDQFRSVAPREDQAAHAAARPLAEALADLDEALDRGRSGLEKAAAGGTSLSRSTPPRPDSTAAVSAPVLAPPPLAPAATTNRPAPSSPERDRSSAPSGLFDAPSLEGYGLIQARLRRALDAEQIRRIDCVGLPVDPDRMTVIDVVDAPDLRPGPRCRRGTPGLHLAGPGPPGIAEVRAPPAASAVGPTPPSFEEVEP